MNDAPFAPHLARWCLTPDGAPIVTRNSRLLPVRRNGEPAILKIALMDEERRGAAVMAWWDGEGAARVFARHDDAILLERLTGDASLGAMSRAGQDDEASRIICAVAHRLHARTLQPPGDLVPLAVWFAGLAPAAASHGGVLREAEAAAHVLLAAPCDRVVLHGDLHHGNVLDSGGERGWLAIDPKGIVGERAFDFANIFFNPHESIATAPGRLARQASVVAEAAGLDRSRLLHWVLAYAGLSAAWNLAEGGDPTTALRVASITCATIATEGVALSVSIS